MSPGVVVNLSLLRFCECRQVQLFLRIQVQFLRVCAECRQVQFLRVVSVVEFTEFSAVFYLLYNPYRSKMLSKDNSSLIFIGSDMRAAFK